MFYSSYFVPSLNETLSIDLLLLPLEPLSSRGMSMFSFVDPTEDDTSLFLHGNLGYIRAGVEKIIQNCGPYFSGVYSTFKFLLQKQKVL